MNCITQYTDNWPKQFRMIPMFPIYVMYIFEVNVLVRKDMDVNGHERL